MAHRPPLGRGRLGLLFFALFPPGLPACGQVAGLAHLIPGGLFPVPDVKSALGNCLPNE